MTTPNPAGYYGLNLPESVEAEIENLSLKELVALSIQALALIATSSPVRIFTSEEHSVDLDNTVEAFSDLQVVSFCKYLGDRIESLLTKN